MEASQHVHKILLQHLTEKALVLGPSPAALARINNNLDSNFSEINKSEPGLLQAIQF